LPSKSIDTRTYQSALTNHDNWIYGRFPLREFGAMREGVVWSGRSRTPLNGLTTFKGTIFPETAKMIWQTDAADRFIWLGSAPNKNTPGNLIPVPKISLLGNFHEWGTDVRVLLSCADILWYFAGYSSELLVGLLNGASVRPEERFFRKPHVFGEGSIDIWPKNYNRGEKFSASIELANILTYGKGAKTFFEQVGTVLVKGAAPYPWRVMSPRVILPFERPVDVELIGYPALLPYESPHPDASQSPYTFSKPAINTVQIRKMISARVVNTIRVFVPERAEKEPVSAATAGAFVTRGQGREILGTSPDPSDIDMELRSIELEPNEFVAPSSGIQIEKVKEERDRDTNGPQFQVVSTDVDIGSFTEPFTSHSLHAAMEFAPDTDIRIKQARAEMEPLPARQLFDQCPNIPMVPHRLELENVLGEPYLNPEITGDEVAFPIPHFAQNLIDISSASNLEIEVLGEDWHPITQKHFSVLEFPNGWPQTKSLRSTNKTRNLVVMIARVRLSGTYTYLLAVERQLRNGIYEGRRLFALKPLFALDMRESVINDILYFVARDQHDAPGQNGWPTETDLCGEFKCRERNLTRMSQDTKSVREAVDMLLETC
jgi:hypothetical protein